MAYVVTTFFAMGFGYAVTATSLGRPIRGGMAAWIGFAICHLLGPRQAAEITMNDNAVIDKDQHIAEQFGEQVHWPRHAPHKSLTR